MSRRRLLLPMLAALHGVVVAVAVTGVPAARARPVAAMTAFQVVLPPTLTAIAPTPAEMPVAMDVAAPAVEIASPAAAAAGCDLADLVQSGLRGDTAVQAALGRVPREARSVAGAVVLWDGTWSAAAPLGGAAALDPIRARVEAGIRAAPAACREAEVTGPRMVFIANGPDTVVLAFGSGQWSWGQLLA